MNNDLDLKKWREYQGDITTDSLWISSSSFKNRPLFYIPKRDWCIKNDSNFHGLFIPEIPYQFMKRFSSKGSWIWDCFAGSGTTKKVADYLNRKNILCTDLNPTQKYIIRGDAKTYNPEKKFDLVFLHPPYHNIVKYSNNDNDGSNCENIENFLIWFAEVVQNVNKYVNKKGIIILIMGNIYQDSEEKTLGVWAKDIVCKYGYKCKAHIIKDYGETKGTEGKNYNLNYYRQLKGGYNNFYGDNIFILRKI